MDLEIFSLKSQFLEQLVSLNENPKEQKTLYNHINFINFINGYAKIG